MKKAEFTAREGQTDIESALLYGKKILGIYPDGVGVTKFITSGSPTGRQVLVRMLQVMLGDDIINQVAQFQFAIPLIGGQNILILYQDS